MKTEENKRMLALSCIVADLKTENMELEQRLHHLVDDYNNVVRQLDDNVNRKDEDSSNQTQDEMQHLRDHCDMLEKNIEQLKRDYSQLLTERNEAKTHADECELQKEELFKHIARFETSEFLKIGDYCIRRDIFPDGAPVKVGSAECNSCRHLLKVDEHGMKCVLCAYCYDNKKAEEELACKPTDD